MEIGFEAAGATHAGCDWDGTAFPVGNWPTGLYMARIGPDDVSDDVYFVVRRSDDVPNNPILVQVPFTTVQAYNPWGGGSFYTDPPVDTVSFRRPTPFHEMLDGIHGDLRYFLEWIDTNAAADSIPSVDFISSIDLARGNYAIYPDQYKLIVSAGHDEYWSDRMVDNMLNYVWQGGNAAFFGGNTCDGRVVFSAEFDRMTFKPGDKWRYHEAKDFLLVGVQTPLDTSGGEMVVEPYEVQAPSHWSMAGVADPRLGLLSDGGTVVGYEVDVLEDHSPPNFEIVAKARYNARIVTQFGSFRNRKGTVFAAGTTGWARGLARKEYGRGIDQVTRNVIRKLAK